MRNKNDRSSAEELVIQYLKKNKKLFVHYPELLEQLEFPSQFKGTNKIESLIVDKIQLGDPDESGRRKPEIKEGSEFEIKADMVIKALGFDPEDLPTLFDTQELQVTKWGTIKTDFDTMETNLKGIFAAGDIVRGASLVVWAIKDGRDAATSIKKYLESKETQTAKVA